MSRVWKFTFDFLFLSIPIGVQNDASVLEYISCVMMSKNMWNCVTELYICITCRRKRFVVDIRTVFLFWAKQSHRHDSLSPPRNLIDCLLKVGNWTVQGIGYFLHLEFLFTIKRFPYEIFNEYKHFLFSVWFYIEKLTINTYFSRVDVNSKYFFLHVQVSSFFYYHFFLAFSFFSCDFTDFLCYCLSEFKKGKSSPPSIIILASSFSRSFSTFTVQWKNNFHGRTKRGNLSFLACTWLKL